MSNYSETELRIATEQAFPEYKRYLCNFRHQQVWERWTKHHKHGLTKEKREGLLYLVSECADASPADLANQDAVYKEAVAQLQQSYI